MTGNDDGDRVSAVGRADRPHGAGITDAAGDVAVATGFTERNFREGAPDLGLEIGADGVEWDREGGAFTGKIFLEFLFGLEQDGVLVVFDQGV